LENRIAGLGEMPDVQRSCGAFWGLAQHLGEIEMKIAHHPGTATLAVTRPPDNRRYETSGALAHIAADCFSFAGSLPAPSHKRTARASGGPRPQHKVKD
jgi:hypothetical protein